MRQRGIKRETKRETQWERKMVPSRRQRGKRWEIQKKTLWEPRRGTKCKTKSKQIGRQTRKQSGQKIRKTVGDKVRDNRGTSWETTSRETGQCVTK